ncbi:hypothetical protein DFH07DRAFT_835596 [Mycena maculata]|uniref:DUF6534 domain-containing protein n=1 Tax=Mycena maculata TaxID=230809 RepID=A0AAD7N429_9AGAR|nr:hypothetical protein DFH07DRAFT_835596 [Mycena maculata]
MSVHSTEIPTLGNTLGAVFLGVVVSGIFFGVSSLQVYYYYHYYPTDSFLHKCSVGLLWLLDATHLALTIFSAYHYGILGFGNVDGLNVIIWSIKLSTSINVVIILVVQSLYAYRVWLLSGYHHGILGYLVTAVVLGGFGIGIVLSYETYSISAWSQAADISWAIEASFSASTAIDILISIAMCYYLRKSKGEESQLNSRISTLMQYTLSCGVFTSACSLSILFTFILMPNNLIFLGLTFLLTRLYVNSFIAMMNARQRGPRRDDSAFALSNHISSAAFSYGSPTRSMPDPESQVPRDAKFEFGMYDVAVPERSVSDGSATYVSHLMNAPGKAESQYTYTRRW